jgi:hypothetical protein
MTFSLPLTTNVHSALRKLADGKPNVYVLLDDLPSHMEAASTPMEIRRALESLAAVGYVALSDDGTRAALLASSSDNQR